jgi:hypothetical protein
MDHNIHNSGNGLGDAVILAVLWIMNLVTTINPSTLLMIITGCGSFLYLLNQALTLYKTIKKLKQNDTEAKL